MISRGRLLCPNIEDAASACVITARASSSYAGEAVGSTRSLGSQSVDEQVDEPGALAHEHFLCGLG